MVHVDDVAFTHIAALDPSLTGNRNFGVNYDGLNSSRTWESANDIVKQYFPEEVKSGLLPANGEHKSVNPPFDASETEKELGKKFKSWEEIVVDLVGYYVAVSKKESAPSSAL